MYIYSDSSRVYPVVFLMTPGDADLGARPQQIHELKQRDEGQTETQPRHSAEIRHHVPLLLARDTLWLTSMNQCINDDGWYCKT